jgi:hypothetical protein
MKRLIILLLLSYIVPNSFGQIYIQPSVGYTFSSHPIESQSILIIDNQKTVYNTKIKFGEGAHLGLNLGYSFKNNFFVELSAKKSIYSKYNASTIQPDLQTLKNFSLSGYFGEIEYESSVFQIAPLIGYQVQNKKFSTYFKVGPNLMKSKVNETLKYNDWDFDNFKYNPLNTEKEYKYTGKLHVGLQANLGLCYSIKQNLQLVLDFVTVYNNYEITKGEIKYYEIDGVSQISKLEDTDIEFDEDSNKLNQSHYGINIGIRYVFDRNNE